MFRPKLFTTLKSYSKEDFLSDLIAGIIVGIVALPLAIAFAIASGVSPEKGLITAVVAGFLISALGGSRVQIGGPTGAFVVLIYGVVQKYGIEGLTICTLMAGIMLIIFGLAQMGTVIKFIPRPVTVGFTSGIAVIIFSSQIKDVLGLNIAKLPADFIGKWVNYFHYLYSWNFLALGIAFGTVALISTWPRLSGKLSAKIPGSLVALILFSFAVKFFHLPVETIGTRFGELPHTLPMPSFPSISFGAVQRLIQPAFAIALLGAIESLLSAVVADGMIGSKHRSNTELIGQGIANIASGLFGGIPATGAIARTATNIKNGGRTPIAGMIHAITLLFILLFLGQWAKWIPLSCLAGILAVVAFHMSEWHSFVSLLRGPRSDVAVLLATFILTVVVDLTVAIEIGMVLSAFLFMHRMSLVTQVRAVADNSEERGDGKEELKPVRLPPGVEMYEINGPLFFGSAQQFEETMRQVSQKAKVQILRLRHVPAIDASGLYALEQLYKDCRKRHVDLVLSGVHSQPLQILKSSGLYNTIGSRNIVAGVHQAISRAEELVKSGDGNS